MSVEASSRVMRSYLDALLARSDFADYFIDDVTWTTIGSDQELQGREPVRDFLSWMHTQAFDAHPKVKTLVVGDGQAALEADFVATHTGEFLGIVATGKSVQVPYCVVYDLQHEKIAALRAYIPMDLFTQQLQ
jgi:predicted ester cyclase